jgi:general secretion pathway protein G
MRIAERKTTPSRPSTEGSTVRNPGGEAGFTLMELLIVIVVLGVIAGIVVFALSGVSAQAAVAACKSDASSVESAVSDYNAETGGQPTVTAALLTTGNPTYLHSMPSSPDYSITIVSGQVMIAAPSTATPVAYGTPNACANAGVSGAQVAAPANGVAATTTTAPAPPTSTTTTAAPTTTTTAVRTTTTTAAPTTTTTATPVANGVTATPTTNTYGGYGGQDIVTLSNTKAITALTVTINVARTTGVTTNGGYNSLPGGVGSAAWSTGSGVYTYTYTLTSGSIPARYSNGQVAAQYAGTGSPRVTSGDTWRVVSTSNGITSTISGTF